MFFVSGIKTQRFRYKNSAFRAEKQCVSGIHTERFLDNNESDE